MTRARLFQALGYGLSRFASAFPHHGLHALPTRGEARPSFPLCPCLPLFMLRSCGSQADITKTSGRLQEELRSAEHSERTTRKQHESKIEGVVHTARNLGQIAAYLLQTGAMEEASNFYEQVRCHSPCAVNWMVLSPG